MAHKLEGTPEAVEAFENHIKKIEKERDELKAWAIEAAQAIEEWALKHSWRDEPDKLSGCRAILEFCPVDFHSSNSPVRVREEPPSSTPTLRWRSFV